MSGNNVDELNFNETCKGYLVRALKIMRENDADNLTKEQEERLWMGLRWAFDEITMQEAREEYMNS